MIPHYLPSPPIHGFQVGPIFIYCYALCILAGMILAAWLGRRRFVARGGDPDHFESVILVAIVVGILGARVYHVLTDWQLYFGPGKNPWQAFNIRNGGLGIMGGVTLGALGAWVMTRRYGLHFASFADVLAPALPFAQAIGRFGNWFNQELFGLPSTLPWALQIDPAHRPDGYQQFETFHPTFLYEAGWNVIGGFLLLWIEKKFKVGNGRLFTCYVIWYTIGRSLVEQLRIDPANHLGVFRIHNAIALVVLVLAIVFALWQTKHRPGMVDHPFGSREDPVEDHDLAEDDPAPTGHHPAAEQS